jgi:cellulose synthase/poly-beta-1,6-N-acetylglucosamine synthase-like glycosyltransferase
MTMALEIALIAVALVLAVPVLVLFLQVVASLMPRRAARDPWGVRPRLAVLIPAHNEQFVIGKTLMSVARQLAPGDRMVVVADNCTDRTAEIARRNGAEVTVRSDPFHRGKGYALDHGLTFLDRSGAPEVVIFLDADCDLNDGCLQRLALRSVQSGRPVQAAYLMAPPRSRTKTAAMVCFAWKVKDFVRPLGWHRLGLPCQLAGSGMAFPWNVARAVNLASGHLAEDLKQGLDLALAGRFPIFCPDAVVISDVAPGGKPSASQRARWEHGTIAAAIEYLPRLLGRMFKAPSLSLLAMALDVSVPPLALLALLLGGSLMLCAGFFFLSGAAAPMELCALLSVLFFATICLAWWGHGREIIPLHWLVFAPVYALAKIPLYGRYFLNRQRAWVRGDRQAMTQAEKF